ncbi:hypothetical protein AWC35_08140 [Gibbsiella quercinecans]|uniref:Uncharacterized protein n=1 Tax=Gibbsiella quercinecans TaxID=929813 RepID=A0A250AZ97_9GAMM|nr:hypothetical protein AWC35_08140 [Gibbsiella quercinecans]RLM02972.1 hypothetical protein BIY30_22980 [Gibbsiella quercinecans]RLM03141.1 hypothetical protein BIY31_22220 [Gibbsiella quercinecans]
MLKLIGTAWRTYYFPRLISQTIFPNSLPFAQFPRNMGTFTAKWEYYQQATEDERRKKMNGNNKKAGSNGKGMPNRQKSWTAPRLNNETLFRNQ